MFNTKSVYVYPQNNYFHHRRDNSRHDQKRLGTNHNPCIAIIITDRLTVTRHDPPPCNVDNNDNNNNHMCTNNICLIHYLIHNTYNSFNECVLMYFTSPICVFVASPFIVHYIPISLVIQDIPLLNVDPQYRKNVEIFKRWHTAYPNQFLNFYFQKDKWMIKFKKILYPTNLPLTYLKLLWYFVSPRSLDLSHLRFV